MPRRADSALMARIETEKSHLATLEADLLRHGDQELASAVKRARRELLTGAVHGAVNTVGVNHGAVRR